LFVQSVFTSIKPPKVLMIRWLAQKVLDNPDKPVMAVLVHNKVAAMAHLVKIKVVVTVNAHNKVAVTVLLVKVVALVMAHAHRVVAMDHLVKVVALVMAHAHRVVAMDHLVKVALADNVVLVVQDRWVDVPEAVDQWVADQVLAALPENFYSLVKL
jgi:hypothetical protein